MTVQNRYALITGASSGFGRSTAQNLAQQGCRVWAVARREERLQQLQDELGADRCRITPLDLSDTQAIADFVGTYREELKGLDILVNNAGGALGVAPFDQGLLSDYDTMMDVNVRGLIHLTHHLIPLLEEKSTLVDIVNVGSVAGRWVYPGGSIYCAAKFAVRAISEGIRQDLCGRPIRVTNIEPGLAKTEFSNVRLRDDEAAEKVYQGMEPLSAQDIAECIVWSLSRPSHVNIQEMVVFPTAQAGVTRVHREN